MCSRRAFINALGTTPSLISAAGIFALANNARGQQSQTDPVLAQHKLQEIPRLSAWKHSGDFNYSDVINRALKEYGAIQVDLAGILSIDHISLPSNSLLIGLGSTQTILRQVAGARGAAISHVSSDVSRVQISGITLDGNGKLQKSSNMGLHLDNSALGSAIARNSYGGLQDSRSIYHDIFVLNTSGSGIRHTGKGASYFSQIWVYGARAHGIEIDAYDSVWNSIDSGAAGLSGIVLGPGCANNRFSNIKAWYSGIADEDKTSAGIFSDGAFRNNFSGVEVQNCNNAGILFKGGSFTNMSSFSVEGPSNGGRAAFDGLVIDDHHFGNFQGIITERGAEGGSLRHGVVLKRTQRGCHAINAQLSIANETGAKVLLQGGQGLKSIDLTLNGERYAG